MALALQDNRIYKSVNSLSPIQKIGLGAAVLTIVAGGFVLARGGDQTTLAPLFTDLEARDAAAVTDSLISQNVDYQLADGGRTVLVPRDQVYDLRVGLSAEGLPDSSEGYALLDRQGITTSEFKQRVDYQRALEGELSKTLRAIQGVDKATVHLALPEDSVFIDEPSKPTASVLVTMSGKSQLNADQVAGMVHLVASSVQDMDPAGVTIADSTGIVLAQDGQSTGSTGSSQSVGKELEFESVLATQLKTMLAKVAGPDAVAVTVQADLDLTERESTSETYASSDPEGGVKVAEATSTETYTGAEAAAQTGVLGPDGATIDAEAPGTQSSYDKSDSNTSYAVNRTVEQTKIVPGDVTRLNVAVLVDEAKVTEEQLEQIQTMVATAAGIDTARGDQLSVTRLAFDTSGADAAVAAAEAQAAEAAKERRESMIRLGVIGAIILVALILAYRSTRKARREVATPIDIGLIRAAQDEAAAELGAAQVAELAAARAAELDAAQAAQLDAAELAAAEALAAATETGRDGEQELGESVNPLDTASQEALDELSELADRRPEEIALILQSWLADEKARK